VSKLDDFLEPLNHGVWEVSVPKESVTEPLGEKWEKSTFNFPSPGMIASYRNGRFHAHETKTEWQVHLDRHDPKVHPILHLVDSPILLMISSTFLTLIKDTRVTKNVDTEELLKIQRSVWRDLVFFGVFFLLVGVFIIFNPMTFFRSLFTLLVPISIIGLAIVIIAWSFRPGGSDVNRKGDFRLGVVVLCVGIIALVLPLAVWGMLLLSILAIWMFSSAVMMFGHVMKGRHTVPEGFYTTLIVGILSLSFAILIFVNPSGSLELLTIILGVIVFLLGLTLLVNGLQLRTWMNKVTPQLNN
jgi:uncharacterized membrane protein HdeD (DUF308 family)